MSNKPYIFLRGLRHVDHTVFCVADGQKTYRDPFSKEELPYSSGQQVKRSIVDEFCNQLGIARSPSWLVKKYDGKEKPGDKVAFSYVDPSSFEADLLVAGYMRTKTSDKDKKKTTTKDNSGKKKSKLSEEMSDDTVNEETNSSEKGEKGESTIKRRSPLSISSLHPLHPLLAKTNLESKILYDRREDPNSEIKIVDKDNKYIDLEKALELIEEYSLSKFHFVNTKNQKRATGFFKYDVCIDLRRLFTVSAEMVEPELDPLTIPLLKEKGWIEGRNAFGKCLICPKVEREKIIPALASALIDWRITSNQSFNFSPQGVLALAITDNASVLESTIYGRLIQIEEGKTTITKAEPHINFGDEDNPKARIFTTPFAEAYIKQVSGKIDNDALDKAKQNLIDRMLAFDYENQLP